MAVSAIVGVVFACVALLGQVSAISFAEHRSCVDGAHDTCLENCITDSFSSDRQVAVRQCYSANPMGSMSSKFADVETCLEGRGVSNCVNFFPGKGRKRRGGGFGFNDAPAPIRTFFNCKISCISNANCDSTCTNPASDATVQQAVNSCRSTVPVKPFPSFNGLKDCLYAIPA